ncbi:MAG: hypothetical protein R3264_23390, partial [Anaerolineae bacterium]|nr:hypothetical protein [Anaerolineae bacterium]
GESQPLARGELLGIIGRNSDGSYLYGFGTELKRGWVAADQLRVTGDLGKAPLLPADPVRAIIEEFAASGGLTGTGSEDGDILEAKGTIPAEPAASAVSVSTLTAADLPPITTGTVTLEGVNARQGPGTIYDGLGVLAGAETVQILATNRFQDWVLVSAGDPAFGWVSIDYLTVAGNIDELPVIRSALPESGIPPGEVAAILSINAEPVAVRGEPAPAAGPGSASSGTGGTEFGAVATAGLNAPQVALRRGPGAGFGTLDTLTSDDTIVSILGRDDSAAWVLVQVQNFTQDRGWVALSDLTLNGSIQAAPVVTTAWVESNGLTLRRGPGIFEEIVGQVNLGNLVAVLGLNEGRNWTLVQPVAGSGLGWVPLQFLDVGASLAGLPQAPNLPVGTGAAPAAETLAPPPIAPRPVSQSQLVIQRSSGGEIVVINPDGSGLRSLTSGIDPALSPDGQTVAFTRWDGAEQGSVLTIGIDGSNERVVLAETRQAKGAAWSPDGSQIIVNFQQG